METIQRYQEIERSFEKKYRQRVERQIRIGKDAWLYRKFVVSVDEKNNSFVLPTSLVKPDASPEEIDQVLDSEEPPQIFAQSVCSLQLSLSI